MTTLKFRPALLLFFIIFTVLLQGCSGGGANYAAGGMFSEIEGNGDLWREIRRGMRLKIPDNYRVREQVAYFQRHPAYFDRMQRNARPYLYEIVKELKRNRLPLELALLPAIESNYRTTVYSPTGAAGLWQFIKSTGDYYGLDRTRLVDKRRDPKMATKAGVRYLKYLGKYFNGDWELAIGAYNGGEGTIGRARKANAAKGLPTDFWSLKIRKETSDYVPRLLALAKMIKSPGRYNVKLHPIPNVPVLATVTTNRAISLRKAANACGMDANGFCALNARYVKEITEPGSSNQVIVPRHKVSAFRNALVSLPEENTRGLFARTSTKKTSKSKKKSKVVYHKVKKGETLSAIARKYAVGVSTIKKDNRLKGSNIRIGQKLKVTGGKTVASSKSKKSTSNKTQVYTVKKGDSVYGIAKRYGITVAQLRKDNGISGNNVKVGQRLKINGSSKTVTSSKKSTSKTSTYRVKKGDTFYSIARKHGVSVNSLQKANGMAGKSNLKLGQTLKIPHKA